MFMLKSTLFLPHIAALLTTCPTDLPVKPNQALPAAQCAYHNVLIIPRGEVCKVVGGNVPVGCRRVHHLVAKGHVVSLLIVNRIFTCVSFCKIFEFQRSILRGRPALRRRTARVGLWKRDVWSLRRLAIFIIHAIWLLLANRLTSFTHALYPSWVSFDPSHFAEVFRSLEGVVGIVDRRRCARAKLVVQLRERYRKLITRGIVAFNFSPRNLTQVTSAMKRGQRMIWFCFGKENNSSRRVILKIELELNNLNSILSRSAVTPVFPIIHKKYHIHCTQKNAHFYKTHKRTWYRMKNTMHTVLQWFIFSFGDDFVSRQILECATSTLRDRVHRTYSRACRVYFRTLSRDQYKSSIVCFGWL